MLLVLSLLFGLWVAGAHGPEHQGLAAHDDPCAVCVLAQGLSGGLANALTGLVFAAGWLFASGFRPQAQIATRADRVRVRGPPLILA